MSKQLLIKAKPRENKKPNALRREGFIPATLYGHHIEAKSIQVNQKEFSKFPYKAYSHLNTLEIEGDLQSHDVLIKTVQMDPVKDTYLNIEFYQITKGEKVKLKVAIKYIGHSSAVTAGGVLLVSKNDLEVSCLPKDIPDNIEANLELITEVGGTLTVKDLKFPEGVIPTLHGNEVLAKVEQPKTHSVEDETPAAAATTTEAAAAPTTAAPAAKADDKKTDKK